MSAKKKVVFCTYSSIYSSKVLEQLIVDTEIELVAIINSTRVLRPSYNPVQGAIYQLRTSGFRYSSYLFSITNLFSWIQPLLIFRKWPLRNIHSLAKLNKIQIVDTRDINTTEVIDCIKQLKPDYLLCAHFNQLLKHSILTIDKIQCINIHPSLLPNYKGVDPVFFAMRDNEENIGVTLHRMDNNFDSGEILLQTAIKTKTTNSLLFNNCQLFEEGVKLALQWIKDNKHISTVNTVNNNVDEDYDSWPTKDDVKIFTKSGKRLMNLSGLWKQQ